MEEKKKRKEEMERWIGMSLTQALSIFTGRKYPLCGDLESQLAACVNPLCRDLAVSNWSEVIF
jgi:hypothetical protein